MGLAKLELGAIKHIAEHKAIEGGYKGIKSMKSSDTPQLNKLGFTKHALSPAKVEKMIESRIGTVKELGSATLHARTRMQLGRMLNSVNPQISQLKGGKTIADAQRYKTNNKTISGIITEGIKKLNAV